MEIGWTKPLSNFYAKFSFSQRILLIVSYSAQGWETVMFSTLHNIETWSHVSAPHGPPSHLADIDHYSWTTS